MPQCFNLSSSDLASMLSQGWTQVSGPFDTQTDCLANCGSSSSSSSNASSFATVSCSQCPNGAANQFQIDFTGITNNICTDCTTVWNSPPANVITFNGSGSTCSWKNLFSACSTGGANWVLTQGTPIGQVGTWWVMTLTSSSTNTQYYCSLASFNCLGTSTFTHGFQAGSGCNFPATVTLSPI